MANSQITPFIPSQHNVGDTGCTNDLDNLYQCATIDMGLNPQINYGAAGDGITDDTTALTNWIADINAAGQGAMAFVPPGHYMVSSPLPTITQAGVTIQGCGWAQSANTKGSVISATSPMTSLFSVAGEGVIIRGMCIDAANMATVACEVTGSAFQCHNSHFRAVGGAASSVCLNLDTGATTAYLNHSIFNGGGTGVQVNATDMIMTGCKPKNANNEVVLLGLANGAILTGNHWTTGAGNQNCIQINGGARNIGIIGNRFDNYVFSAIQITPTATPVQASQTINITGNVFYSNTMTNARFPLIAVDTSGGNAVLGLSITGNNAVGTSGSLPLYFLGAYTQAGAAASSASLLGSQGLVCNSNAAYVSASFFGPGFTPTAARGNIYTVNGTSFTALPDI